MLALFLILAGIKVYSEATFNVSFCRGISFGEETISCVEEPSPPEFYTTETNAYIVMGISGTNPGDQITYEIIDSSQKILREGFNLGEYEGNVYFHKNMKDLAVDEYSFKLGVNCEDIATKTVSEENCDAISDTYNFAIIEEIEACEELGFYCCQSPKACISLKEGTCDIGYCCESEEYCKELSLGDFKRRQVTNCEEEGLTGCERVVKLYEYSINDEHIKLLPEQKVVMEFRGIDIDCYDKKDVAIAYYNEEAGAEGWIDKTTSIEETDVEDVYKATALIGYLGYTALIRTDECVPRVCTYGGYRTDPVVGYVEYGETIGFEFCSMIRGCNTTSEGICSRGCPQGADLDCVDSEGNALECTNSSGDCCLISNDDVSDPDCAPHVDPDYCDKEEEFCCPSFIEEEYDKSCGAQSEAQQCTSEGGDCCNPGLSWEEVSSSDSDGFFLAQETIHAPKSDGVCDPDCPMLNNGIGYVDVDCCTENGISVTSTVGDCCYAACDGICDLDCVAGLDPDCYYECYQELEEDYEDYS